MLSTNGNDIEFQAFPSVEELFFFKENGDAAVLDIAANVAEPGIKFEDRNWSDCMSYVREVLFPVD